MRGLLRGRLQRKKENADRVQHRAVRAMLDRAWACSTSEAKCIEATGTAKTHHVIAANKWKDDMRNPGLGYRPTGTEDEEDGGGDDADADGAGADGAALTPAEAMRLKKGPARAALLARGLSGVGGRPELRERLAAHLRRALRGDQYAEHLHRHRLQQ